MHSHRVAPSPLVAVTLGLAVIAAGARALADPPARARAPRAALPEIPVHGEIQRPQQFDLSGRSPTEYRPADPTARFVPRVVTATRRGPF
jgi:hypothetical protein